MFNWRYILDTDIKTTIDFQLIGFLVCMSVFGFQSEGSEYQRCTILKRNKRILYQANNIKIRSVPYEAKKVANKAHTTRVK
jgi:hypothetical protein